MKQRRTCLRCQREFESRGVGNRICPKCATVNRRVDVCHHVATVVGGQAKPLKAT